MRYLFQPRRLGLGLLLFAAAHLHAQKQPANPDYNRSENQLLLEKAFIDAMREKMIGNEDEAVAMFKDILNKDKDNAACHYQLAQILSQKALSSNEALKESEAAANLERDNIDYQLLYINLLDSRGDFKQAALVYEQFLDKVPENLDLHLHWAYLLSKAGKIEQAIKAYDKINQRIGPLPEIYYRKYLIYTSIGKSKQAETALLESAKLFPGDMQVLLDLAKFYQSEKKTQQARAVYKQILEQNPYQSDANLALSELFAAEGDEEAYVRSLGVVFATQNIPIAGKLNTLSPLVDKAVAAEDIAYVQKISNLADILAQNNPSNPQALYLQGRCLWRMGNKPAAAERFKSACVLHKNRIDYWTAALSACAELGQIAELKALATETSELFPAHAVGFYYLGLAQNYQSDWAKAAENLELALPMSAADAEMQSLIYQQLAKAYFLSNKSEKGLKAADAGLKLQPENPQNCSIQGANLLLGNQRAEQAASLINKAANAEGKNPLFLTNKAILMRKNQNNPEAKLLLEQALANGGQLLPETLELYGNLLFAEGQTEKAVEYWQKALNLVGNSAILQKKISNKQPFE